MNYRHIYHAGNVGDVLKHVILIAIVQSLQRKDTPFCFLDTHAGIGQYNLLSEAAQKSREADQGIRRLLEAKDPPLLIQDYLKCVASFNLNSTFSIYPGSPAIMKYWLRPEDKMVLCELHEEDLQTLKHYFRHDKQVAVHLLDAYQGLKAFLPPKEKRGLVLIDPPYEKPQEYDVLLKSLPLALQRFRNGIFALWYPIKEARTALRFVDKLRHMILLPTLNVEVCIYPPLTAMQLNGSGVFIINPPYQLKESLQKVVPWLWKNLSQKHLGQWRIN